MIEYISQLLGILGLAFGAGVWVTHTKINSKNQDRIEQKLDDLLEEIQELKVQSATNNVKITTMQNQIAKISGDNATYM